MVVFLSCQHTLLGHVEFYLHRYAQVLLPRAALDLFSTQPVLVLGIVPTQVQDLALSLIEHHEVLLGLCLKPIKIPLDDIPALQHVNHITLAVSSKLVRSALNPAVQ